MATKTKTTKKGKVKVNKLEVKKGKVNEVTDKESKKIRGGLTPTNIGVRRYN